MDTVGTRTDFKRTTAGGRTRQRSSRRHRRGPGRSEHDLCRGSRWRRVEDHRWRNELDSLDGFPIDRGYGCDRDCTEQSIGRVRGHRRGEFFGRQQFRTWRPGFDRRRSHLDLAKQWRRVRPKDDFGNSDRSNQCQRRLCGGGGRRGQRSVRQHGSLENERRRRDLDEHHGCSHLNPGLDECPN